MSIMSRNNFLSPPLADNIPLLPRLNDTIVRSVIAAVDLPNLASGENANVESGDDDFFYLTSNYLSAVGNEFFGESGSPDKTEITPPSARSLFGRYNQGEAQIAGGDKDEVVESRAIFGQFSK
jgi:hypothetical protein